MKDWRDVKGVDGLDLKGKTVFLRVDFNVPVKNGEVTDATRIEASLPTIKHIVAAGGKLAIASHLGRPEGKRDPKYSLEPVSTKLAELLGCEVHFIDDCVGYAVKRQVRELPEGGVLLLENLRFYPGEEENDEEFVSQLADGFDVYVNDAFGTAHRAHASTYGVPMKLKEKGAGFLMKAEIEHLGALLRSPKRPFVAILGGAKVSDKIGVLKNLIEKADTLLIGGAMANTFLAAKGFKLGDSLVEDDRLEIAGTILGDAEKRKVKLILPEDFKVASTIDDTKVSEVGCKKFPEGKKALDIGERTIARFKEAIASAGTIFWNGPLGVFEKPQFAVGTMEIARAVAESGAESVVGGGDSIAAINISGVANKITHISTGGGASLKFVEGKELPAIKALCE
ncbi:MAG: phosphoglycerate kinase [Myxococcota bacterium]